ncbi:MAG: hypothetical protein IAE83_18220 [Anaerolinea sp.]|nr:hypothetical protein [Anaerolinea sp.]
MKDSGIHVLGVRHHGPGSARSVLEALERLHPDLILVEGPPEGNGALPIASAPTIQPPVALLVYAPEHMDRAGYFPFAEFSPEWNALQFGLKRGIVVRFMDMPIGHRIALDLIEKQSQPPTPPTLGATPSEASVEGHGMDEDSQSDAPEIHQDPLYWLARAAGFSDGERWWDYMVEQRRRSDQGGDIFKAILHAMTALRRTATQQPDRYGLIREAFMRRSIRAAQMEGFKRIAVVCGAWHAPALSPKGSVRADMALTSNLPRVETQAVWVPWTHGRLSRLTGYSAGIVSPGWYHHLWTTKEDVATGWITQVARLLREQDLDASPAQIIDAVRLSEALAALRDRPLPGLPELNEAILATLCFGNPEPLRMIYRKLMIGERMGRIPNHAPTVPLQRDLERTQTVLEMPAEPTRKDMTLDLREERDLNRSILLHRLRLIEIPWGALSFNPRNPFASRGQPALGQSTPGSSLLRRIQGGLGRPAEEVETDKTGTSLEKWTLEWRPEFAVRIIEMSAWGHTVQEAATAYVIALIVRTTELPKLTRLIELTLLADLPALIDPLMSQLQARAALTSDVNVIMDAIPSLVKLARYGNVRNTDSALLIRILRELVLRVCVMLPNMNLWLAQEPQNEMLTRINQMHVALLNWGETDLCDQWLKALHEIIGRSNAPALLTGRMVRLLFEAGVIGVDDLRREASKALSQSSTPEYAASWLEGYLRGGAVLLLHDEVLWGVLRLWVREVKPAMFKSVLPVLRRAFTTFSAAERRKLGERLRAGGRTDPDEPVIIDSTRGEKTLAVLALLLGIEG